VLEAGERSMRQGGIAQAVARDGRVGLGESAGAAGRRPASFEAA
jgi:hypothetical protein